MAILEFNNVQKKYDNGFEALHNINVSIKDGEFVVIIGPSGCGKSTLLRMVAGLEEVTSGEIKIGSQVVNNLEPSTRNISMVFQNYALYPHMNVEENISYGLKIAKMPKIEIKARVEAAAELLGLKEVLKRKPRQLSGGQRQRVALGRAIVRQPKVFLFDEPLSNLDAMLRVQMRLEIRKLHQKLKVTSLYVTHDQVEAMTLADRIIVLKAGKVEQIGTPQEIFQDPASAFVATFIGSPSTNLFLIRVNDQGDWAGDGYRFHIQDYLRTPVAGQEIYCGIRPEHFCGNAQGIPMKVDMIESLGTVRLYHLSFLGGTCVLNSGTGAPDPDFQVGQSVRLWVDKPEHLRFFDKSTSKRIY